MLPMQGQAAEQGPCVARRYSCLLIVSGHLLSLELQGQLLQAHTRPLSNLLPYLDLELFIAISDCLVLPCRVFVFEPQLCNCPVTYPVTPLSFPSSLGADDELSPPRVVRPKAESPFDLRTRLRK